MKKKKNEVSEEEWAKYFQHKEEFDINDLA